jgi:hypothetical protein
MAMKESSYWIADAYAAVVLTRSLLGITLPEPVGKEASESSALQNIFVKMKEPCIPTLAANSNRHRNRTAIGMLNLFLGWTLFGWLVALLWADTDNCEN